MATQGNTALITGASGGIGEALAKVFAEHGFNLVLVARSADKLQALATEFSSQHGVQALPLPLDLSDPTAPAALAQRVAAHGLGVDVLVNNAGFGNYGEFVGSDLGKQLSLIQVNITALTELTHRFLPAMVERKRGFVMNVASTAAFMPGPLMAVYYASKAYVLSFSEALREELKGSGVNVSTLCPGPVATGFQQAAVMEGSRLIGNPLNPMMSAQEVAKAGYEGMLAGKSVVIPGAVNQVQALVPRLLPRAVMPGIIKRVQGKRQP